MALLLMYLEWGFQAEGTACTKALSSYEGSVRNSEVASVAGRPRVSRSDGIGEVGGAGIMQNLICHTKNFAF